MKKFAIAIAALVVIGTMSVMTINSRSAATRISPAEGFPQAAMAIDELTVAATAAQNLPNQSFDAF